MPNTTEDWLAAWRNYAQHGEADGPMLAAFRAGWDAGRAPLLPQHPAMKGKLPIVLYFSCDADRDAMVEACRESFINPVEIKVP